MVAPPITIGGQAQLFLPLPESDLSRIKLGLSMNLAVSERAAANTVIHVLLRDPADNAALDELLVFSAADGTAKGGLVHFHESVDFTRFLITARGTFKPLPNRLVQLVVRTENLGAPKVGYVYVTDAQVTSAAPVTKSASRAASVDHLRRF